MKTNTAGERHCQNWIGIHKSFLLKHNRSAKSGIHKKVLWNVCSGAEDLSLRCWSRRFEAPRSRLPPAGFTKILDSIKNPFPWTPISFGNEFPLYISVLSFWAADIVSPFTGSKIRNVYVECHRRSCDGCGFWAWSQFWQFRQFWHAEQLASPYSSILRLKLWALLNIHTWVHNCTQHSQTQHRWQCHVYMNAEVGCQKQRTTHLRSC